MLKPYAKLKVQKKIFNERLKQSKAFRFKPVSFPSSKNNSTPPLHLRAPKCTKNFDKMPELGGSHMHLSGVDWAISIYSTADETTQLPITGHNLISAARYYL